MIPIVTELTETCPPELLKKEFGAVVQAGLLAEAEFWHHTMLPWHFQPAARWRYGYKPRSPAWQKRKRALAAVGKAKGTGDTDLVFSGMLQEHVTQLATFRATPREATVTMRARSFVQMRLKSSSQPNFAAEITKVIPAELESLTNILNYRVQAGLEKLSASRVTRN